MVRKSETNCLLEIAKDPMVNFYFWIIKITYFISISVVDQINGTRKSYFGHSNHVTSEMAEILPHVLRDSFVRVSALYTPSEPSPKKYHFFIIKYIAIFQFGVNNSLHVRSQRLKQCLNCWGPRRWKRVWLGFIASLSDHTNFKEPDGNIDGHKLLNGYIQWRDPTVNIELAVAALQ